MERFFVIKINHRWEMFLDPKILEYFGEKEKKYEGCLTCIGEIIEVERYPMISVQYYNLKGELVSICLKDFEAQVFQHELNHLDGVEEKLRKKGFM